MYDGKVKPVPIPSIGKTHIQSGKYVYWYNESKWDKSSKQTKDNRRPIGKLVPGQNNMIYPNKIYFELFGNKEEPVLKAPGRVGETLNFGPYAAMYKACEKVGCLDALKTVYPDDWQKIFALAVHSIDAQNSVGQDFPFWGFHNYCGIATPMCSKEVSVVYDLISEDPENISSFLYLYGHNYKEKIPNIGPRVVAFDSTNQNTNSRNLPSAEYGHPKIDEQLPDINTALFTDEKTGIPLYYEHFYGSLIDKVQSPYTLEKVQDLGFEKLFYMCDCGYFSKKDIQALDKSEFGVMCPDNLDVVKIMMKKYSKEIKENEKYYIRSENIYGVHDDSIMFDGKKHDLYLFYDPVRAKDEVATIHLKVDHMIKSAMEKKKYTEKLEKSYGKWLIIEKCDKDPKAGRNFTVKENIAAIQECIDQAGYFVVMSNAGLSADHMILIARARDTDEKSFRRLKSHFGLTKTYVHKPSTYEGKMFMAFIALITIEAYRYYEKEIIDEISSTTTATTIGELRKYQIYRKTDGSWMPKYAMTKIQKRLFAKLDLSEKDVEDLARNVIVRV